MNISGVKSYHFALSSSKYGIYYVTQAGPTSRFPTYTYTRSSYLSIIRIIIFHFELLVVLKFPASWFILFKCVYVDSNDGKKFFFSLSTFGSDVVGRIHSHILLRVYMFVCACDALYHIIHALTQYLYESFILGKITSFSAKIHAIVRLTHHHSTQ